MPLVAIAAYQGALADEAKAYGAVFGAAPGIDVVVAGVEVGELGGPGGFQVVTARFDDVRPDVVAVPGGLGSHHHPEIAAFIERTRPRYVIASSTGSALLAAGGLLTGRRAATHWLAAPLLEAHGVTVERARVVTDDPYVTCSGLASLFDAVDLVLRAWGGQRLVDATHAALEAAREGTQPCRRRRWGRRRRSAPAGPSWEAVEIELEEVPARRR